MDTVSSHTTHSKSEKQISLRISTPAPQSSRSNTTIQQQPGITNTRAGDIPPPQFMNSITELRSFSTALSEFLCRYDELLNHFNFINSCIDSKLPTHIVGATSPNQSALSHLLETVNGCSEVTVSDQNPKHGASDCERNREVERTPDGISFLHNSEEIDNLKESEVVDVSQNHDEIVVCTNPVEIDTLKKREFVDVSKNHEEIDISKRPVKIDTSKKPEEIVAFKEPVETDVSKNIDENVVLKKHAESDASKKPEETVPETSCDQTITAVPDAIVSEQNPNGIGTNCEQIHESLRMPENLEEIDVLKKPEVICEQTDILSKLEEIDILKKTEQTDICKNPEKNDVLHKPEEIDASMNPEEIDVLHKPEEIDASMNPEEIDVLYKPEEINTSVNAEEIDVSHKPEEINTSMNREEIDVLHKPGEIDTSVDMDWEEIDTLMNPEDDDTSKNPEEIDILKKTEQTDICKNPEEIDALQKPEEIDASKNHEEFDTSKKREGFGIRIRKKAEEINTSKNHEEIDTLKRREGSGIRKKAEEINVSRKHEETGTSKKSIVSVLESLCKSMCAKELKRHVTTHYSEMNKLHKQIANALKLAKDPAKLVLTSVGRFFVQGSRTFCKGLGSHQDKQNAGRLASVLILECFVMISDDDIEIAKEEQEYVLEAAIDWRNRMIREGGLRHTEEVDARGLLFLISGFGIQDHVFKIKDIADLIRASNVKGISSSLRRSVFLVPRIPEVVDLMVKNNLEIEAADIAYTFKLEDKCHPRNIVATYLHKKLKDIQNASSFQKLDAMKQQLSDLKSVKQCLESHNVDPSMLLPDFEEKIQNLEKEINEGKSIQKRKSLENPIHHESKRACYSHESTRYQEKRVDHYGVSPHNRSPQPRTKYNDFDRNRCNSYINNYSPSPDRLASGLLGSYDQMVHPANVQPYGWHEPYGQHYSRYDQTYEYDSQPYARPCWRGPPESFPGFRDIPLSPGFPGRPGPSSDLYGFADIVEKESRGFRSSGSNGA